MTYLKNILAGAVVALGFSATGAAAATCSSLSAAIEYADFTSCTVTAQGNAGQDNFANVNAVVSSLFGDAPDNVVLDASKSYSPGPGTGSEFGSSDLGVGNGRDGFETQEGDLNRTTFTFNSLPLDTLFVSLKQGNGFELFGLAGLTFPIVLSHALNGNDTSHISTFGGSIDTTPVPVPASLPLLLGAVAFGGFVARRRKA